MLLLQKTWGRMGLRAACLTALVLGAGHINAAPAKGPTLADALGRAPLPAQGIALAVGAENVKLPPGASVPDAAADGASTAEAFGQAHRQFGVVLAIAPAQMTVLNDDPINPNPYEDLEPEDALRLLAASLSEAQWQALTGEAGLGQADLTGDTQRQLFAATLPHALLVTPRSVPGAANADPADAPRDLTASLNGVHLRLRRRLALMVPEAGSDLYLPANATQETGKPHYRLAPDAFAEPKATLYGVPVKAELPNVPKSGDLDFTLPDLQTPVTLAGAKTVGDLIFRIGIAAHREIYPDARWEHRTVTVRGQGRAVPAADGLRALAFCLTGTYRKVGPAFVLTDDRSGVGTRRERWRGFEAAASGLRRAALTAANAKIAADHALPGLTPADDALPFSAAQQKEADAFHARSHFFSVTQTLGQLTPAQQAAVSALAPTKRSDGTLSLPNPAGRIIAQENPSLELLTPALDGPIDAGLDPGLYNLFDAGALSGAASSFGGSETATASAAAPSALPVLIQSIARRAALLPAPEPADMPALAAKLRALGLNEWWLVLPANIPIGASETLLRQAVQAARPVQVTVFPVIDLLEWNAPVPAALEDLTLLGQTSAQARAALAQIAQTAPTPQTQTAAVSPCSPVVQANLAAVMRLPTAVPGLGGMVWRSVVPSGYSAPRESDPHAGLTALGYTEAMRLAFLRARHADPIDLFPDAGWTRADTQLPIFDDPAKESALLDQWQRFRIRQNSALLQSLYPRTDAQTAGGAKLLPLFVQSQGDPARVTWFGTWDSPKDPLSRFQEQNGAETLEKAQAKAQSHLALVRLPLDAPLTATAVLGQWTAALGQIARHNTWDGFVLDVQPTR